MAALQFSKEIGHSQPRLAGADDNIARGAGYRPLPLGEGQFRVDGVKKGVVIIGES
jgi:hypothetical protein